MERLRAKKQAQSTVVGVAWYTEEDWARVKAAATDSERFEATYAEWDSMALKALADIRKTGVNATKFFVSSDELLSWCLLCDMPNNAGSRAEFVSEKLRLQYEAGAEPCSRVD